MCGRTACALDPDAICKGCAFKDSNGTFQKPVWKNAQNGKTFFPSYNISPGHYTPVMISSQHFQDTAEAEIKSKRVIQPMRWGLVPSWHKGNPNSIPYQTNNCKSETMLEKKMFKVPLEKGRRCVVLAEGYYEWKKSGQTKQPYFITQQTHDVKPSIKVEAEDVKKEDLSMIKSEVKTEVKTEIKTEDDAEKETKESVSDEKPSKPLMKMAGVFDICRSKDDKDQDLYSYTVVTVPASAATADIHHRMPAILSTEEDVEQWLDFGAVPIKDAVKLIKPQECIHLYPVSTVVNNSRNNSPECVKPLDMKKPKSALEAWLKKIPKKEPANVIKKEPKEEEEEEDDDESETPAKKIKQEE
ncbi:abasic site processing protein HMCES [Octopus sinensis]|uniref:Abasic site processing protein HMCES n=1 Tax=Octopus sinensis TaxID=2607531 RepID=A0A6P7TIP8_9MOLL|nr:abasic site processing protein HMCES [Octopus sinensis]